MYAFALILLVAQICVAQRNYNPLPPQVRFVSNAQFTGALRTPLGTFPTTGSMSYLAASSPGGTEYEKREIVVEFGLEQTNTWEVETQQQIDLWEITSLIPDTCLHQTYGDNDGTYPDCTPWSQNPQGAWIQNCTISIGIRLADLSVAVVLSPSNLLQSYNDQIFLLGNFFEGETVTVHSQGTTAPMPADFTRPSICDSVKSN